MRHLKGGEKVKKLIEGTYFQYGVNRLDLITVDSAKNRLFPDEIKYEAVIEAVEIEGCKDVLDNFIATLEEGDVLGISSVWALATDFDRKSIFARLTLLEDKGVILRIAEEPEFSYEKYRIMAQQESELDRQLKEFKFSCGML